MAPEERCEVMVKGAARPPLPLQYRLLFHLCNDRLETFGIIESDLGQCLAVQVDVGLLQTVHEYAVAGAIEAAGGIDPLDPQGAEIALLQFTAIIGVREAFLNAVLGNGVNVLAAAEAAFGHIKDLLPPCAACYFVLTAWHRTSRFWA